MKMLIMLVSGLTFGQPLYQTLEQFVAPIKSEKLCCNASGNGNLLAATALSLLVKIVSQTTWPAPLLQRRRCTVNSDATFTAFSTSTVN